MTGDGFPSASPNWHERDLRDPRRDNGEEYEYRKIAEITAEEKFNLMVPGSRWEGESNDRRVRELFNPTVI